MVAAQEAAAQPLELEPSGEAYLKSLGYRGIDPDVAYYDPTAKLPPLETGQEPPKPSDAVQPSTLGIPRQISIPIMIVVVAILIGLAVLVAGGNITLSLGEDAQNPARGRRTRGAQGAMDPAPPADLQAILATSDRRRALVMLVQATLARTVAASGVLLQPSWTLRDALGHIPRGHTHLDALRSLVLAGERVLFGNRDVTEDEFQAHLARVRPLMTGAAA